MDMVWVIETDQEDGRYTLSASKARTENDVLLIFDEAGAEAVARQLCDVYGDGEYVARQVPKETL